MLGDLLLIQAIILFVIPRNTNLGTEGKIIFFIGFKYYLRIDRVKLSFNFIKHGKFFFFNSHSKIMLIPWMLRKKMVLQGGVYLSLYFFYSKITLLTFDFQNLNDDF